MRRHPRTSHDLRSALPPGTAALRRLQYNIIVVVFTPPLPSRQGSFLFYFPLPPPPLYLPADCLGGRPNCNFCYQLCYFFLCPARFFLDITHKNTPYVNGFIKKHWKKLDKQADIRYTTRSFQKSNKSYKSVAYTVWGKEICSILFSGGPAAGKNFSPAVARDHATIPHQSPFFENQWRYK